MVVPFILVTKIRSTCYSAYFIQYRILKKKKPYHKESIETFLRNQDFSFLEYDYVVFISKLITYENLFERNNVFKIT